MQKRPKVSFAYKAAQGGYFVSQVYDLKKSVNDRSSYDSRICGMLQIILEHGANPAGFTEAIKTIDKKFFKNDFVCVEYAKCLSALEGSNIYLFGPDIPSGKKYMEIFDNVDSLEANVKMQLRSSYARTGNSVATFFLDDGGVVLVKNKNRQQRRAAWEYDMSKSGGNSPSHKLVTKELKLGLEDIVSSASNGTFYFGV